jgi:hypothetical protein
MQISLTRLNEDQHRLQVTRDDGSRESIVLETRSYLLHDLLHLAVEAEAGFANGFWGCLAQGKSLADMNDRTGASISEYAREMSLIEQIVGVLTAAVKGSPPSVVLAGLHEWMQAQERASPTWLDEPFIARVQERMRKHLGRWAATRHGQTMTVTWPPKAG